MKNEGWKRRKKKDTVKKNIEVLDLHNPPFPYLILCYLNYRWILKQSIRSIYIPAQELDKNKTEKRKKDILKQGKEWISINAIIGTKIKR